MSGNEVRKVSQQEQLVRNLIKHCLQLYMNQKEVVDTLLYQAKIEPTFTQTVWKQLEEENREFFEAYHFRLLLKSQIHIFNKLLKRQHELMQKIPLSNRPTSSSLQPQYYLLDHASTPSRPNNNMYCNGGSNGTISANQRTPHLLSTLHNSQMERSNGMNGISETSIKSEAISNSSFAFGSDNDNSLLDMQTFPGSEPLLDNQSSSFGFLSQIPRNLSFSDLIDDFAQHDDGRLYTISEWPSHDILGETDLNSIFKKGEWEEYRERIFMAQHQDHKSSYVNHQRITWKYKRSILTRHISLISIASTGCEVVIHVSK